MGPRCHRPLGFNERAGSGEASWGANAARMGARPGAWPWPQQERPVLVGGQGPRAGPTRTTANAAKQRTDGRGARQIIRWAQRPETRPGRDHDGRCGGRQKHQEAATAAASRDAREHGRRPTARAATYDDRDKGEGGGISGGSQQSVGDGSGLGETR